ncbi:MAG TPA: CRTAC1 family protein [Thermoanaerobaculia bacterium]|nr:CRTAC1 family protein [Thermoanaerobaculia bacterium]
MSWRAVAPLLLASASLAVAARSETWFREVAADWGLDVRHHHGGSGERYMVETMVGGVLVFDYDGDGDADVLFVDGAPLPGYEGEPPRTRLLRNEGAVPGDSRSPPRLSFVEVTVAAGIDFTGYGCGAVAGDIDGDGDQDVYLTAFGANALYRNEGDGTFVEVGGAAGVADEQWSSSATFFDPDRDGDLDLYVVSYVDFALDHHVFCGDRVKGIRGYCHPDVYQGLPDRLYRNRGDGTFEEVAGAAGLGTAVEAGLGVVAADFDGDGWSDLYVANDLDPNLLFHNRGDGTFEDVSLLSGAAYSHLGKPEAGMGVEAADLDGDGAIDLVVTNFALETNAFYRNVGGMTFIDRRFPSRLAEPSLRVLGFGVAAHDFDHDGDLDLLVANGHILDNAELLSNVKEYAQPNQLYANRGDGVFDLVAEAVGTREEGPAGWRVSRGLATGDLDGDGDLDAVLVSSNQVAEVYENVAASGSWLQVDLLALGLDGGTTGGGDQGGARWRSTRDAIGARLEWTPEGASPPAVRERRTGSSYLSQSALPVHFGWSETTGGALEIRWPKGTRLRLTGVPADRRILVVADD